MKLPFRQHHLVQLLEEYDKGSLPLDAAINRYFRSHKALGSKDRQYIAETAFNMIRWLGLLSGEDWLSRLKIFERVQSDLDHPIEAFKDRCPLYQCVSFPEELFELLVENYGEEKAVEICLSSNHPAPTVVRVNSLKTSRDNLLKHWKDFPVKPCLHSPYGILFEKRMNFFNLEEYKKGYFEVQDEASQLVAQLVRAKPGDQVLDFCAGSGGKTLALAPRLEGQGQIYLHDIRPHILREAKKRLRRAGIQNAQILLPDTPQLKKMKKSMDWVLVDAPCTGTGTYRRNPDMKWRFSKEKLQNLIKEQKMIFEKALSFVKPGGHIVYATCSILKQENQMQTDHFLKTHPIDLGELPFQSFPSPGEMDGFYGAVFTKHKF